MSHPTKIITLKFDKDQSGRNYGILLDVFKYSVSKNMPDAEMEIIIPPLPKAVPSKEFFMTKNTVKLEYWVNAVEKSKGNIIIMDCDMLVLRDLSDAFKSNFDIAYTSRGAARTKLNGGVIFIKVNERSIKFLRRWVIVNQMMYENPVFHWPYRRKYVGMNQASLGYMLENETAGIKIINFPCTEWNQCQEDWNKLNLTTRCVHIKSALRIDCMSGRLRTVTHKAAFDLWIKYQEEMNLAKRTKKDEMGRSIKPRKK